ncbi:protein BTG3-like, partial [Cetorhinus maximus]
IHQETMKEEIGAGVSFLVSLVRNRSRLHQEKIEEFGEKLTAILYRKYQNHWYPANPSKGQAYRCIRINRKHKADPSLLLACQDCDLEYNQLRLPKEITLWIDPQEVCCRLLVAVSRVLLPDPIPTKSSFEIPAGVVMGVCLSLSLSLDKTPGVRHR